MLELLCPLTPPLINQTAQLSPLLDLLCDLPSFSPERYDLNQHGSWRQFDLEKTRVDALSQRVQLLRIQGEQPDHLAMISLGKLGEQPTLVARLPEVPLQTIMPRLIAHAHRTPFAWMTISSPSWASQLPPTLSPPISPLIITPTACAPEHLTRVDTWPAECSALTHESTTIWKLSDDWEFASEAHLEFLRSLHA